MSSKTKSKSLTKKATMVALSTAVISGALLPTSPALASTLSNTITKVINTTPVTQEGYTNPLAPITLKVETEKGMRDKENIGVLISDGENYHFATKQNGNLAVVEDGTTLTLTAKHTDFGRYTTYTAQVLVGSEYNKFKASLNSNGHAKAFAKLQENKETALDVQFKTGSAIGEATKVSANLQDNAVKVTENGNLVVVATDDYGNPATDATLTVSGKGTGNKRVASSFKAQESTLITNGLAKVSLLDHSANTVALSYKVMDNKYTDSVNSFEGTDSIVFLPGQAEKAKVSLPSTIKIGDNLAIAGELLDTFGNGVTNEEIVFSGALTGIVSTNAEGNLQGTVKVNYSGAVTAKVGTETITLTTTSGTPISSITATQSGIDPETSLVRNTSTGIQYSTDGGKTWTSVYVSSNFQGFVYDSVHKVYVGISNGYVYGNYGTYNYGFLYTSTDGIRWTQKFRDSGWFKSIATDGKGTVVVGGGRVGTYGIDSNIYTTNNGGTSFSTSYTGYKSNYGYGSGVGVIENINWNGSQFVAKGQFRYTATNLYSANGYSWHR